MYMDAMHDREQMVCSRVALYAGYNSEMPTTTRDAKASLGGQSMCCFNPLPDQTYVAKASRPVSQACVTGFRCKMYVAKA